jgi:intracellular sulfur oxidation DsrE/DsrF family protein
MKKVFKLYIDELGMSHPASFDKSPYYILVGCVIDEQYQNDLENHANHIKYKYWGNTDIILHSADMARNTKEFHIFANDPARKESFYKDLLAMLNTAPVTITAAIIDKEKAYKSFWAEQTVISRSTEMVLFNFLAYIFTKLPCRGKIVIEASNFDRDTQYLKAFNNLLSPSFIKRHPEFLNVRKHLTSINFVTKQNHDTESQVADLLAYGIRCMHGSKLSKKMPEKDSYEYKIMNIAQTKLMKMAPNMGEEKKKYFALINPVGISPKRVHAAKMFAKKEKRG